MKFRCTVCGFIYEGDAPPANCPQCKAPAEKFVKVENEAMVWAAEHIIGVAKDVDPLLIIIQAIAGKMQPSGFIPQVRYLNLLQLRS